MECPICGGKALFWRYHQQTPILRCTDRQCGFRFFDLAKWTTPDSQGDYYADWRPQKIVDTLPWIRARVDIVKRLKPQGAVAELGCGIGETAIALDKAGYRVAAVEESEKAIGYLTREYPSVAWRRGEILDFLAAHRAEFDVVTMFHVLEHIPQPKRAIERSVAALRPDGVIVVEVPDVGGGWARLNGAKWEYYLDHHVNYFDVRSLRRLFGTYGFRMVYLQRTYHFSHPQGHALKDAIKGTLAALGLNSIIRTAWARQPNRAVA